MLKTVKHRPIHRSERKALSYPRIPYSEPLTPGLRKKEPTNQIGFTVDLLNEQQRQDELLANSVKK